MAPIPALLERYFRFHAGVIGAYPRTVLVISILFTLLGSSGWLKFRTAQDMLHLFGPSHSHWKEDRLRFSRFFNITDSDMRYVLVRTAGDGNESLLDEDVVPDVVKVLDTIETKLAVHYEGKEYRYLSRNSSIRQLCNFGSPYFQTNRLTKTYLEAAASSNHSRKARKLLRYPVTSIAKWGGKLFLPFYFGGVRYERRSGAVTRIRALALRYVLKGNASVVDAFSQKLMQFGGQEQKRDDSNQKVLTTVYTWAEFLLEIRQVTFRTLRLVPFAVVMVLGFTVLMCTSCDLPKSGHCHAVTGLISVVFSFSTGMGIMFWSGLEYNDLISVTSFLALAIGVDDTFILMKAWKRNLHVLAPKERLVLMMVEAGPSITFTSFTDVVAFSIGATMKIPAMHDFCVTTAAALAVDFLFQVTFFPACVILLDQRKSSMDQLHRKFSDILLPRKLSQLGLVTLEQASQTKKRLKLSCPDIIGHLKQLVSTRICQVATIFIMIVVNSLALYGITQLKSNTELGKLLVDDSPMKNDADLLQNLYWSEALLLHVVVKSPDFCNKTEVANFKKFVTALESQPLSVGRVSTDLWADDFIALAEKWQNDANYESRMGKILDDYLKEQDNFVQRDVRTKEKLTQTASGNKTLLSPDQFHFSTGYWGVDNWEIRANFLRNLSRIRAEYSQFEPALFTEMAFVTDLQIYTDQAIKQTLGIVLLTTFVIGCLFIPLNEPGLVFLVCLTFFSVNTIVVGFLSLWGTDIDVVSMCTVLMSVGFSVDYTVHMAFTYSRQSSKLSNKQRVDVALEAVAIPIVQSGASTLVAVWLMIFVKCYMMRVFLKTILLVVLAGLFETLFFLPTMWQLCTPLTPQRTSVNVSDEGSKPIPKEHTTNATNGTVPNGIPNGIVTNGHVNHAYSNGSAV